MDDLHKIIDRYTEGNYLIGKTAKEEMAKDILALFIVGKRIYLTFADHTCDGAYSTLEKANERIKQIKQEYPDMDGVYVISRDVE